MRPVIGGRVIFQEILLNDDTTIRAGTDIPFAADGKSDCSPSSFSPKVGFLCPGMAGRVIFPEILLKDETTIRAGTDIPFAANGKSDCSRSCCSPEVGFLGPGILRVAITQTGCK